MVIDGEGLWSGQGRCTCQTQAGVIGANMCGAMSVSSGSVRVNQLGLGLMGCSVLNTCMHFLLSI